MSLEKFLKIKKIVQIEAEKTSLGKKTLETNQMRKEFNNLTKKIKERIEKYINKYNLTWTRIALLRLIYIKKKTW